AATAKARMRCGWRPPSCGGAAPPRRRRHVVRVRRESAGRPPPDAHPAGRRRRRAADGARAGSYNGRMTGSDSLDGFLDKWRERWPEWPLVDRFLAPELHRRTLAWFALLQEFDDMLNTAGDPLPANAKL